MSRFDIDGMFWSDMEIIDGKKVERKRPLAGIPKSKWKQPTFPDLRGVKVLGLDTETYDPALMTFGPGWARESGHIVGVSLAVEDGTSWYYPVRHTVQPGLNMDPTNVFKYLRDLLKGDNIKVGANLQYDVGWLLEEDIVVKGKLYDVQFAEALINDTANSYSLESLARKYIGDGKVTDNLYVWSRKSYGGGADQRANMFRCPPSLVGPYAEADASLPIDIIKKQWEILSKEGLLRLFEMECKLIPILIGMRKKGMRVDLDRADRAKHSIREKIVNIRSELNDFAGFKVGVNTNMDIQRMFDKANESYPLTDKGNPSFVKDFLTNSSFQGANLIAQVRKYEKAVGTFIEGAILDKAVDSVVYPSFHPLRGEWGGTVSGRFSSSKPNAQQIPSRNDELAPLIRGMFIPDEGKQWLKMDYSQIEYRLFAHFSGDAKLIKAYQNTEADFHRLVGEMLGYDGDRVTLKTINFGLLYGMGRTKLIETLENIGVGIGGEKFLTLYHERFPAAKRLIRQCSKQAQDSGEVRTILNRKSSFNLYEPRGGWSTPLPYSQAVARYGRDIQRSQTHKALNRMLQGSSADLMKKAMVVAYEAGIFDKVGYPCVTVHDELDFSYHPDLNAEFRELKSIMENCIKLKVPVIVDIEMGADWGHLKEVTL